MPIGIGVIGAGSRICSVVENVQRLDSGIQMSAVFDPDRASVDRALSRLNPSAEVCSSAEELCGAGGVDWVFVGSPNAFHASQVAAALSAGRDVFCEKPLATSVEGCALVAQAVESRPDRKFFFGLVLRYSPFYRRISEILEAGVIGRIVSFEFNETLPYQHGAYIHGNWRRHRRLAGTHLLEKCCHDIDVANWFTGSIPVRAAGFCGLNVFTSANRGIEEEAGACEDGGPAYRQWPDPHGISPFNDDKDIADNHVAILEYASGARATFHTNCHAGIPERRIYICGERGSLRADALTSDIEVCQAGPRAAVLRENAQCAGGHAGSDEPMARHLVGTMRDGVPPSAGIREALDSTLAALLADLATDEGRVVSALEVQGLYEKAAARNSSAEHTTPRHG